MKIIEFLGMPRSGKTEQIQRLSNYLTQIKIKHKIITDREIEKEIKIPIEKTFEYNLEFFKKILEKIQEFQEYEILILDRGFIDGEAWLNINYKRKNCSKSKKELALKYLNKLQNKYINFGILMIVNPKTTFRRYEQKKEKSKVDDYIMNKSYIEDLYNEYLKLKQKNNILILDGNEQIEILELKIKRKIKSLLKL